MWKKDIEKAPPVGLEPTTFELEVQCASPLRHGGSHATEEAIFTIKINKAIKSARSSLLWNLKYALLVLQFAL